MKANAYGYGVPHYVSPPRKGILHSEAFQLLISWGAITVAFGAGSILSGDIIGVALAGVAVGTGFIFHELAHRQVARYYGVYARYRAWYTGLLLAVTIAFLSAKILGMPFVLAAPGAVYIVGAMGFIHPLLELRIVEAEMFFLFLLMGAGGLLIGKYFLENFLPLGEAGEVPSGGFIFFLNIVIGLKVGAGIILICFYILKSKGE